MTTKWENEIPVHYRELFENYKNIEMFQNINDHPTESCIEGFNFAGDDFDMHKSRKKMFGSSSVGKDLTFIYKSIRDFILCPFYNSDQIIDNGIKTLLNMFLAVKCNEISKDVLTDVNTVDKLLGKKVDFSQEDKIYDLTDLIDTNLLYSNESFENKEGMRNKSKKSKKTTNCKNEKKQAQNEINKYSKTIKNEIYNILFLPIIVHMFYNCYYMLYHRNSDGTKPEFIDIETKYYNPSLKPYLSYFFDIAIKPLTWFYNILFFIANPANEKNGYPFFKSYVSFSEKYPYVVFILLFIFMYSILSLSKDNIISTLGSLIFRTSGRFDMFTMFAIGVMIIEFFRAFVNEFKDWSENIMKQVISGPIKFVIYWILRMVINIMLYPAAGSLCSIYLFVYLVFGVSVSNDKDAFDVFEEINDANYEKMYKRFDNSCGQMDWWGFIVKYFFRFVFLFLIELTILSLLLNSMTVYSIKVSNSNILSFLLILVLTSMFILGIISFMKYLTTVPYLNAKYDIVNAK